MGSTSIRDVGSLFGSLSIGAQDLMANKISNNISATGTSDSASFQSFLSANSSTADNEVGEVKATNETKAEKPASKEEDTSDRIAGEDKADAGKTTATDEKQVDKNADDKTEKTADVTETNGDTGLNEKPVITEEEETVAIEVFSELAASFLIQVSEILNITPEEAQDILADMNLEATDLLDATNLSAFALRAMGAEDSLSLLTNETQFEQFQNVNEALKTLLAQPSGVEELDVAELKTLVEDVMVMQENEEGAGEITESAVSVKEPEAPIAEAVNTTVVKDDAEVTDRETETKKVSASADQSENSELKQVTTSEGSTLGAEANLKASMRDKENSGRQGHGEHHNRGENAGVFQNPIQDFANVQVQGTESFSNIQTPVSPQEIANQIMDYMRSQVKPDMQTLEMQLHPASLGNIQISLVHKDGNITANFACQDEQVKAVLENQLIQLQQRFEEQGIKVNSIEVSVGTHGFEQNLEQQGHQEEQRASQEPKKVRRLQLGPDFLEEDIEELEGDDRIAAEMMAANGGTMDVQV